MIDQMKQAASQLALLFTVMYISNSAWKENQPFSDVSVCDTRMICTHHGKQFLTDGHIETYLKQKKSSGEA